MADAKAQQQHALEQLQMLEQNMQAVSAQKQQFAMQQAEIEVALSEILRSGASYKIVGSIMVQADKESLKEELESKKDVLRVRLESLEKQESKLKDRAKEIQDMVLGQLSQQAQQAKAAQAGARANPPSAGQSASGSQGNPPGSQNNNQNIQNAQNAKRRQS